MDKKYISCLVNDKVGVCAISLVLDKRQVTEDGITFYYRSKKIVLSVGR